MYFLFQKVELSKKSISIFDILLNIKNNFDRWSASDLYISPQSKRKPKGDKKFFLFFLSIQSQAMCWFFRPQSQSGEKKFAASAFRLRRSNRNEGRVRLKVKLTNSPPACLCPCNPPTAQSGWIEGSSYPACCWIVGLESIIHRPDESNSHLLDFHSSVLSRRGKSKLEID